MRDLNDLYFFAQVVEHNGFAAAARALLDSLAAEYSELSRAEASKPAERMSAAGRSL